MKKKIIAILFVMIIGVVSCFALSSKHSVPNQAIPSKVSHIEFWNGGNCIFMGDNCKITMYAYHSETIISLTDNPINFYTYEIICNGKTTVIVDSEALAILFVE